MRIVNHRGMLAAAFVIVLALGTLGSALATSNLNSSKSNINKQAAPAPSKDPYYLPTSPVSGKPLGDKPVILDYKGRELRFVDQAEADEFTAHPDKYLPALDQKIIADQLPLYAMTVCPITHEELGGMGEPVDYVYGNRLVRFCCGGCIDEFTTHPDKYLKELDAAAIEAQGANYPLDHCLVLPDEKPEAEHSIIVGGRLFELCCGDCEKKVRANPAAWIAKLDAARGTPAGTANLNPYKSN